MIYVLRLEHGKYYIGRSENVNARIQSHRNGTGSEWTKLHKFVEVDVIKNYKHKFYEDMVVKMYMDKYGIENVRGGSYSQIHLDEIQMYILRRELNNANDRCFECGGSHFVHSCRNAQQAKNNKLKCIIGLTKSLM